MKIPLFQRVTQMNMTLIKWGHSPSRSSFTYETYNFLQEVPYVSQISLVKRGMCFRRVQQNLHQLSILTSYLFEDQFDRSTERSCFLTDLTITSR